jgi:hypothetical protein
MLESLDARSTKIHDEPAPKDTTIAAIWTRGAGNRARERWTRRTQQAFLGGRNTLPQSRRAFRPRRASQSGAAGFIQRETRVSARFFRRLGLWARRIGERTSWLEPGTRGRPGRGCWAPGLDSGSLARAGTRREISSLERRSVAWVGDGGWAPSLECRSVAQDGDGEWASSLEGDSVAQRDGEWGPSFERDSVA